MLKSWRTVARPHRDVIGGTFQQSDFAADISRVANGGATEEYQNPVNFFARTFVTEGLKQLLASVANRLNARGGEPVIELQTNFGGGKTHTLLAVYHLATREGAAGDLPGLGPVLASAGVEDVPRAKVAVIDGNALAPNQPIVKDGLEIRTVWGFMAYQLLGAQGFAKVAESDAAGTSPGKVVIEELLRETGPCVILMDELVAYYRQFNTSAALKGGTYESNISFVQALTEAVKGAPTAILLASLPDSSTEAAGAFGMKVLKTLEKTFGRVNSIWRPVSAEEGFEIVKRRLFEDITDADSVEETCRAFDEYYHANKDELPNELQEGAWHERIRKCYPIHPEVFARLYEDWSTMQSFQKTRGVLQLMALVINRLWRQNDDDPMILPASLPLDDDAVLNKCAQYLPTGWAQVIDVEIDGQHASAKAIDAADPRLGAIRAACRVARTIFLGSASGSSAQAVRGIEYRRILLGCALPGQELSFYDDAVRKLRERQHYLFNSNDNYWYDTKPTLKRTMETYMEGISATQINECLATTLRQKWGNPSGIASVHVFAEHKDVPDDITSGLRAVVLPLDCAYTSAGADRAFDAAKLFLDRHGVQPRMRKNRLVFLAADLNVMVSLTDMCRTVLAWRQVREAIRNGAINATLQDAQQVDGQQAQSQRLLDGVVASGFRYLLVPVPEGAGGVTFDVMTLDNAGTSGRVGEAVERALVREDLLIREWAPKFLKQMLANVYFKNGVTEVSIRRVWTDMASFYSLPRISSADVFLMAVQRGVSEGGLFGYARGRDGEKYEGFKFGEVIAMPGISDAEFLIQDAAAAAYKQAQAGVSGNLGATGAAGSSVGVIGSGLGGVSAGQPTSAGATVGSASTTGGTALPSTAKRRFTGQITLDISSDVNGLRAVVDEVLSHLSGSGARVKVQLDIAAQNQNVFSPNLVRTVSENATALQFQRAEFN